MSVGVWNVFAGARGQWVYHGTEFYRCLQRETGAVQLVPAQVFDRIGSPRSMHAMSFTIIEMGNRIWTLGTLLFVGQPSPVITKRRKRPRAYAVWLDCM